MSRRHSEEYRERQEERQERRRKLSGSRKLPMGHDGAYRRKYAGKIRKSRKRLGPFGFPRGRIRW